MTPQNIVHKRLEARGVLWEAAVAGCGQDAVVGVRDERRGALAARERIVVLAVHDQGWVWQAGSVDVRSDVITAPKT